jgi:hypothetical protein
MATRYMGITVTDGPQLVGGDVIGAASGGTLAGSQNAQVVFDDAVYDSTYEGKQRLLNALALITARIKSAKVWPITSSS